MEKYVDEQSKKADEMHGRIRYILQFVCFV